MNPLQIFYTNQPMRDSVRAFMVEMLKELAWERAFEGEPVQGIREANQVVDKMFDKLTELYGKIPVTPISNSR